MVALCAAAPVASASTRPPVKPGSRYLALGDSVTFGYEESTVTPPPNYHDAASFVGYPEQLSRQLKVKVTNAACPGETTSSFIDANAVSNGCENTLGKPGGYRVSYPLHVNYKGSQLSFAISFLRSHRNVRLVSLMIGANDLFVCQETTQDGCGSSAELGATLATIKQNVHRILSAIRHRAHYRGQVVVVRYYSLNYSSPTITAASLFLNGAQAGGAKPFHVQFADGFGLWQKASTHSDGMPCAAGLLTQTGPSLCGVHPSYAGQALLAQAVAKATRLR
jgi:lysophospholipase L1-like esterase